MAAATPATHSPWPADPAEHLVVVLGASPKPERYSNQAVCLLREMGYRVIPVHPRESHIEGIATVTNLAEGLSDVPLSHAQTLQFAAVGASDLMRLLPHCLQHLGLAALDHGSSLLHRMT